MTSDDSIDITSDVIEIQSSMKRVKLMECFKSKIGCQGEIFQWSFFAHGKTNSEVVLISFIGVKNFSFN